MTKVVNYKMDGTGRDSYISYGNGGFYKTPAIQSEEVNLSISRYASLPTLGNKINLYHNDGSGRDSYILNESDTQGGFYSVQPKINFMSNLRFYERSPERLKDNDFLRQGQHLKPLKEKERQLKMSQIVERVTHRLQLPKLQKKGDK
ncbi:hypothetical protein pb186bvf_004735 [Paramecium bursaria]